MNKKGRRGVVREVLSEYHYLLILMKIRTRDWDNKLEKMNIGVDKKNDKTVGIVKGQSRKVCWI